MKSNTVITIIFTLVVAAVLIGEVYVYTLDTERYSSDVRVTADGIEYSVTSGGSECYSVLVLDNGSFGKIDRYYVYYDESYGSDVENVQVPVGAKAFTQQYYISQLIEMLSYRDVNDIDILNASELSTAVSSDISSGDISAGLVVLSGAFPDTVYTGNPGDPILEWLSAGGSLYWAGNLLGAYYATSDGNVSPAAEGYEDLFFGQPCLNTGQADLALSDVTTNDYRHTLSMMNNRVKYGVDISKLASQEYLAVGYTEEGFCSTVMVGFGDGMICVMGGDYSNEQRHDLAQLISSSICHSTSEDPAGYAEGDIERSTVNGTITVNFVTGNNYTVYVYFGGYYPVYGRITGLTA